MARPVFCLYFSCRHFPTAVLKKRGYLYANPLLNKRNKNSARSSCVLLMMRTSVLCFSGRRRNLLKKTKKGRKLPTRPEIPLIADRSVEFFYRKLRFFSKCPPPEDSLSRPKGESLADEIKLPSH